MASLKDKFKSKMRQKNEPETMQCFDQTCLSLQLSQGKTQLIQMKVHCAWTNSKINMRIPKLQCQWYNRTQKNYQQITGIQEDNYQPSILDVGTIIEVTCIPELPGVNYEGMPILLKSEPITLASETEAEANRILETGKGKFLVNLKEVNIQQRTVPTGSEALLKIEKGCLSFFLLKVAHSNNQLTTSYSMSEEWPQLVINRKNPRKILMKLNQQDSCVVLFKNGEMRDSFCLFIRLFLAKRALDQLEKEQEMEKLDKIEKVEGEHPEEEKIEQLKEEALCHVQEQRVAEEIPVKEEESVQLSSSESFKSQKTEAIRQNKATDLLQLLNLKEQNTKLTLQNSKLRKQLDLLRQKCSGLQNRLQQTNERLQSASKNYFELEQKLNISNQEKISLSKEIQTFKNYENSKQEQMLYYKNEIKLLSDEKQRLISRTQELTDKHSVLTEEVQGYRKLYSNSSTSLKSYQELFQELRVITENYEQLKLKSSYYLEQRQKMEENLKNSRNLIEQMQSQKKYFQKRYESLSNELNSSSISPHTSRKDLSRQNSLSSSFVFQESPQLETKVLSLKMVSSEGDKREKQILDLQKQLKQVIEQNNQLRSMLTKEKKSSSRTHLKLELMEAKKIVSRLSEEIAEKQSVIGHLKSINKEINTRKDRLEVECQELLTQIKTEP